MEDTPNKTEEIKGFIAIMQSGTSKWEYLTIINRAKQYLEFLIRELEKTKNPVIVIDHHDDMEAMH